MRLMMIAAALSATLLLPHVAASSDPVEFHDYPALGWLKERAARPLLNSAFSKSYRTRLRDALTEAPNFSGHYVAVAWGCGSAGCLHGGVVNLNTGEATEFPQTTTQSYEPELIPEKPGVDFGVTSRLIVFRGIANEDGEPAENAYVLEGNRFRLVSSFPIARRQPVEPEALTFHGYTCSVDCSGHEAGYRWAEEYGITDAVDCSSNSGSFVEGCVAYVSEQD